MSCLTSVQEGCNSPIVLWRLNFTGQLTVHVSDYVRDGAGFLIVIPAPIHVGQLLKARSPVIEVVIVLVSCARRVEGAD